LLVGFGLGVAADTFLAPSGGIAIGVGFVLGLGLWLLVRSAARRQTTARGKALGERLAVAAHACRALDDYAESGYEAEHNRLTEKHAQKLRETDDHYLPRLDAQKRQYEAEVARIETEYVVTAEAVRARREAEAK